MRLTCTEKTLGFDVNHVCVFCLYNLYMYTFIPLSTRHDVQLGRFAKVLDLFDEALEPSLRVAFDGTDSTPCLDARRLFLEGNLLCVFFHISIFLTLSTWYDMISV